MGSLKDAYEILSDLWDRLRGGQKSKKANLADDLEAIATLLDEAIAKFEKNQIPRREGHELAEIINNAEKLAKHFEEADPKLPHIFEEQLPKVDRLMRKADVFYEEYPQYVIRSVDPPIPPYLSSIVQEACKEMERSAGDLSGPRKKIQETVIA